jgi:hypothetical protein
MGAMGSHRSEWRSPGRVVFVSLRLRRYLVYRYMARASCHSWRGMEPAFVFDLGVVQFGRLERPLLQVRFWGMYW